jgi:hypothetical protein
VKKIASAACSTQPDVIGGGAGFDAGLFTTFGGQVSTVANGNSGEFALAFTGTTTVGLASFDSYVSYGVVYNAPTNASLNSTPDLAPGGVVAGQRFGLNFNSNGWQATAGPSLVPATVGFTASGTKVTPSIPYLGYVFNNQRAVCKLLTGK